MTAATHADVLRLDLAVPAPVGQRLDCKHFVAEGKPVYPVRRSYYSQSACSPECKHRMIAENNYWLWRSLAGNSA